MTVHLLEAIKLNLLRAPRYASLTGGSSIKISFLLIASEMLSLLTSLVMDLRAKKWQKKGLPIFVHEFIPMANTPKFKKEFPFPIRRLESMPRVDLPFAVLKDLIASEQFSELSKNLNELILDLAATPHALCMTRHTLESFLRCANLAPLHINKAKELGLPSPRKFEKEVLSSHVWALGFCLFLDKLSFDIQNSGIPIVYQDVPPIPPNADIY